MTQRNCALQHLSDDTYNLAMIILSYIADIIYNYYRRFCAGLISFLFWQLCINLVFTPCYM